MRETMRKTAATTETSPDTAQEINYNMEHPWRRKGFAILGTVATVAGLGAAGFGVYKYNAEAQPMDPETATEEVIDNDPTADTETEASTPEVLSMETFPFVVDGERYYGISEFEKAFTIPATPADEYPGTSSLLGMSDERAEAFYPEAKAAVEQWLELPNMLLSYEFTDQQREQYADYEYTNANGDLYLGVDAVRAQFVGEAFREVMTAQSEQGAPYPQDLVDELIDLSIYADYENQARIERGEEPYEIRLQPVEGTNEIGGYEVGGPSGGIFGASGTVQIEVVTNQENGDGSPIDLPGAHGLNCVSGEEPVVWQLGFENLQQPDGTAAWKATSATVYDMNGNIVCGNLPQ